MTRLSLSIATTDYDHFRDFRLGAVAAEGIDVTWLNLGHHECFARFTANREFDVSEMSFAKFSELVTQKDSDIIGLPVICSRRPGSAATRPSTGSACCCTRPGAASSCGSVCGRR